MTNDIDTHWSKQYALKGDFRALFATELAEILSHVKDASSKICLDIGCGTGGLTRELYHRGYECTGIDISSDAIDIARSSTIFHNELTYIHGNFETDDVAANHEKEYSLITCKLVYAFMRDKEAFLDKVYKIMSDDGTFIIITPVHTKKEEATPISVDGNETLQNLETRFRNVTQISLNWATCYLCIK